MAWDWLLRFFRRRTGYPRDRMSKIPRAARKAASAQLAAIQTTLDKLSALPGIADVAQTKRVPKGFYALVDEFFQCYDSYIQVVSKTMGLTSAPRPGTAVGQNCCLEAPIGVAGIEGLAIYRKIRTWKDFPQVAQKLAHLGQQLFDDIQKLHHGQDPQKIRMNSLAVIQGRHDFNRRGHFCPFYEQSKQRCRIWDQRPQNCRMHFVLTDPAWSDPRSEHYKQVEVKNIRLPLRQQVALAQLEKRMMLSASPFLYANILQLMQLNNGQMLLEVGEAPMPMAQDGTIQARANRSKGKGKLKKKAKKK